MEDQVEQLPIHLFRYFVNEQHEKVGQVPNDSNQSIFIILINQIIVILLFLLYHLSEKLNYQFHHHLYQIHLLKMYATQEL